MFENNNAKNTLYFLRVKNMEAMRIALRMYLHTKDERFLEFAKSFGANSARQKQELEALK